MDGSLIIWRLIEFFLKKRVDK